jgi:hypothetical protein
MDMNSVADVQIACRNIGGNLSFFSDGHPCTWDADGSLYSAAY